MEADISSQAVGLASNTDFSLIQLFIRADFVVKSVIIILIACSVYSWAIIIEKVKLFKKLMSPRKYLRKDFGNLSRLNLFITLFLKILKILWLLYLDHQWRQH